MGNRILQEETRLPSAVARRSLERALGPRVEAYLDEVRRLLRAGVEEMQATGSVDPRVSDIVRRAGLSNKAFYRHFRSKDELLLAILDDGLRSLLQAIEARMARARSPVDRVRAWITVVQERALLPEVADATRQLVIHRARLIDSLGEPVRETEAQLKAPLVDALAEARESGALPACDPEGDADVVYHLAMGWMQEKLIERVTPTAADAKRVIEFALRGLERPRRRKR